MCRLFGFRSVITSQVHSSLVQAENALVQQSEAHPDGWGVAYYILNSPHVIKSSDKAIDDRIFKQVSGVVRSNTVLAHLRKATLGEHSILNTHPFQYGKWVFAHNGNIKDFKKHRKKLLDRIDEDFKNFILGETDSEVLFYLILTHLRRENSLDGPSPSFEYLKKAINLSIDDIVSLIGPYSVLDEDHPSETFLSFIITDGNVMTAHQGGKKIYYSTYKRKCSERDSCLYFSNECENPTLTGKVNHLIFSSEPLSGENIWIEMKPGEIVGTDSKMIFYK